MSNYLLGFSFSARSIHLLPLADKGGHLSNRALMHAHCPLLTVPTQTEEIDRRGTRVVGMSSPLGLGTCRRTRAVIGAFEMGVKYGAVHIQS
jgi:hypothetical protein